MPYMLRTDSLLKDNGRLVGQLQNWLDQHKRSSSWPTYSPVILTVHFKIAWLVETGSIDTNVYSWPTYFPICQLIH